jgi:hypothetical protein
MTIEWIVSTYLWKQDRWANLWIFNPPIAATNSNYPLQELLAVLRMDRHDPGVVVGQWESYPLAVKLCRLASVNEGSMFCIWCSARASVTRGCIGDFSVASP